MTWGQIFNPFKPRFQRLENGQKKLPTWGEGEAGRLRGFHEIMLVMRAAQSLAPGKPPMTEGISLRDGCQLDTQQDQGLREAWWKLRLERS